MKIKSLYNKKPLKKSKINLYLIILVLVVSFFGTFVGLARTEAANEALVDVPGSLSNDLGTSIKSPNSAVNNAAEIYSVSLSLQPRNEADFEKLANDIQNPSNPNYHRFLSNNDFLKDYAPTTQDIDLFKNYFQNEGLQITYLSTDRLVLTVSGTLEELDAAFNTRSEKKIGSNSTEGFINVTPLKLPANLVTKLKGVAGFDTLHTYILDKINLTPI